jgi:hypothetical protein
MKIKTVNMRTVTNIFTFILMVTMSTYVLAQKSGELENVEIEIVKERKLQVPAAERKFGKIAPQASDPIYPPIVYRFNQTQVALPELALPVRPFKLKKEDFEEPQKAYVRFGLGNYFSPYGELYYSNRDQSKKRLAANAWFDIFNRGPVEKDKSGNGQYGANLSGSVARKRIALAGEVDYRHSFWHFYGDPLVATTEAKELRQHFDRFSMAGGFTTTENKKSVLSASAKFNYLSDRFDARETILQFQGSHKQTIKEKQLLKTEASYYLINRQDAAVDAKARNLFLAQSVYEFSPLENLVVTAGAGLALENDTLDSKDFHLYPKVTATYKVTPALRVRAFIDGNMVPVTLASVTQENPWLAPNIALTNTNEAFVLGGQAEATILKKVDLLGGISIASVKQLYFFNNAVGTQEKFVTEFDKGATERTNVFMQVQYSAGTKTLIALRYDGFSYNTDTLKRAWHRPGTVVALTASHLFSEKLRLSSDFTFVSGLRAQNPLNQAIVTLPNVADLSLKADYHFSKKAVGTLQLANILNQDYQQLQFYRVRGFQIRAGLTWSF